MKCIILLCILSSAFTSPLFTSWISQHGKVYADMLEQERRFLIFQRNVELVAQLNAERVGGEDVQFDVNQFADMTQQEFREQVLMAPVAPQRMDSYLASPNIEVPSSWDWREKGAVTEARDQGTVGTCWTFSTVGNIEGQHFLKTGQLVKLSTEQLVDCDGTQEKAKRHADCGVFGGWPYLAFQYVIANGGLDPEEEYPYCVGTGSCHPCMAPGTTEDLCGPPPYYCDATKWPCRTTRSSKAVKVRDWAAIKEDEAEIAQQLVSVGPLSILVNANHLQFYKKGIWNPLLCDPTELDHAVLLVGYGEEGKPYWTIKNSWGGKWGENGHYRIVRGKGKCGMNAQVVTAIL